MPYEYVVGMPDLEVIEAATAQVDRWGAKALDRHRLCYLPEVVRRDIIQTRGRGFCATKVPTRHSDRPATLRVVPCGGDGCADRCAEEQTRDLIARASATWGVRPVRRLEFADEEMRDRWYASCGLRKRHPGAVSVPVTHGRRVRHGRGWVSEAPVDRATWDLFRQLLDDARHLFSHEAA